MRGFVIKRLNMIMSIIFCFLLLGFVYSSIKTPSRSSPRRVVSSASWVSSAATIAEQMAEADLVVRVKVVDVNTRKFETTSPRYTADGEIDGQMTDILPFTDSTMQVLEVYKGEAEKQITVMQTGGVLAASDGQEAFEMVMDESPIFVSGDEHILFLVDISGDPIHAKGRKLYSTVNPAGRYFIQGTRVFSPYEFSESATPPKTVDELLGQIKQASTSVPEKAEWVRHEQWSDNANIMDWNVSRHSTALLVGFVAPENRHLEPRERPSTAQFDLQKDESFSTLLILGVGGEESRTLLVSVFLDYQQVSFSLDGQLGLLHEVEIAARQNLEIPLQLDVPTSGWHDMFVVVFPDPNFRPTSIEERQLSDFFVGGKRTVLCKEDCTISEELPLLKSQVHVGQQAKEPPHDIDAWPLITGDEPAFERVLFTATAEPKENFPLQLWAGNSSDEERNYVVLPLLNYQSFPFGGESRLRLRMPPNSELFIPSELLLPAEPQVHELQFITIFDPYQPLETVGDPFVNSILRSAIVVEETQ